MIKIVQIKKETPKELIPCLTDSINNLIVDINKISDQLLAAYTLNQLGKSNISTIIRDGALIAPYVGVGVHIEPIPIHELQEFLKGYPDFLFEVFQGKLVYSWNYFLDSLFSTFVDMHISGKWVFKGISENRQLQKIYERNTLDSISILDKFSRFSYKDRMEVIKNALTDSLELNQLSTTDTDTINKKLETINKHICIRNAIQHHNCLVYEEMLEILKCDQIEIFDNDAKIKIYEKNDKIRLSFSEINLFSSSMIYIGNKIRGTYYD